MAGKTARCSDREITYKVRGPVGAGLMVTEAR